MRHATSAHHALHARASTRRLLPLEYHPEVSAEALERLENAARVYGLSLNELELLGQDSEYAAGFTQAVLEGDVERYLPLVPWDFLERRLLTQKTV